MVEEQESLETRAIVDPEDIKEFINSKMERLFGRHQWYKESNSELKTDRGQDLGAEGIIHKKFRLKYRKEFRCKVPKFIKLEDREAATAEVLKGFEEYLVKRIKASGYKLYSMGYIGDELKRRMRNAYFTPGYHKARSEADKRGRAVRQEYQEFYNKAEMIGVRMKCGQPGDYIQEFKDLEEIEI